MSAQRQDQETEELRRRLQALRLDPPDDAFRRALHLRLSAEPVPARPQSLSAFADAVYALFGQRPALVWPAVGVLCGAATFAVLLAIAPRPRLDVAPTAAATAPAPPDPSGDVAPTYAVPATKVAVIKLNFAATVAVEEVTFEVTLPEGLAFWSGGQRLAERSFRWPGKLQAGDNLVPIAVRGERAGRYHVKARVELGTEVLEHEVVLEVKGDRA